MSLTPRDRLLKRLTFRSWHRGWKETDLLLGNFANRHLHELSDEELELYQTFLEESDPDIFAWFTGKQPLPETLNNPVVQRIMAFSLNEPA